MNILITGAGSGHGLSLVKLFLKNDFTVYAVDKTFSTTLRKNNNNKLKIIKFDLLKLDQLDYLLKSSFSKNHIDCVINNAKAGTRKNFFNEDSNNFDLSINVNLKSYFFFTRSLIPYLKKNKSSVINISSVLGNYIGNESPSYHLSKYGIISLTKLMAYNLKKFGIRVNCISPGFLIKNENLKLFNSNKNKIYKKKVLNTILTTDIGYTNDLYNLIEFLISKKAKFINGDNILLDGGSHSVNVDPFIDL